MSDELDYSAIRHHILPYTIITCFVLVFLLDLFIIEPYCVTHFGWARALHHAPVSPMYSAHHKNLLNRLSTIADAIVGFALGYLFADLLARLFTRTSRTNGI